MNAGTLKQAVYTFLLAIACLVAVYAPTFLLVSLLIKSRLLGKIAPDAVEGVAAPCIILTSTAIALIFMAMLARRRHLTFAAYGFKTATLSRLALALVIGLLLALSLHALSRVLPLGASLDMGNMRQWQVILFFWIGAPIQEEVIFRGFVQSVVQMRHPTPTRPGRFQLPYSALVPALLFAAVHIATARLGASLNQVLFIVFGALVLGLVAGWLRWKSGSLVPGILVHALFNILAG